MLGRLLNHCEQEPAICVVLKNHTYYYNKSEPPNRLLSRSPDFFFQINVWHYITLTLRNEGTNSGDFLKTNEK